MRTANISFAKITSKLGNGLARNDIIKMVESSPERQTAVNVIFQ